MRENIVEELVKVLTDHDQEEKRLIHLCRERKCKPSQLPASEKTRHDELEWLTLDIFYIATKEEGEEAIERYDNLKMQLL